MPQPRPFLGAAIDGLERLALDLLEGILVRGPHDEVRNGTLDVQRPADESPLRLLFGVSDLDGQVVHDDEVLARLAVAVDEVDALAAVDPDEVETASAHEREQVTKGGVRALDVLVVTQEEESAQ